ncbi:hypothetical protein AXZ07_13185 [Pseudomonas mosselii]|nr:hypothetical protein AXZ07_13185 [Pseudomonas mosselii]
MLLIVIRMTKQIQHGVNSILWNILWIQISCTHGIIRMFWNVIQKFVCFRLHKKPIFLPL